MERLLSSEGICKALYYNKTNFLDQSDIADPSELIYSKIYPYKFIPDVNSDQSSFITMSFGKYRPVGHYFKSGFVTLYVIMHRDLYRTDYGFLRTDYILGEIEELINSQRGLGFGKPEFHDMDEIHINEKYSGSYVTYKLYEFN